MQTKHGTTCILHGRNMLFPPSKNSTSGEVVLTKHAVVHVFLFSLSSSPDSTTATLSYPVYLHPHYNPYLCYYTHCCSSNKRSRPQRPHRTYTETTAMASHPCPYCIQNLPRRVQGCPVRALGDA